jgi:hypothetical protein
MPFMRAEGPDTVAARPSGCMTGRAPQLFPSRAISVFVFLLLARIRALFPIR